MRAMHVNRARGQRRGDRTQAPRERFQRRRRDVSRFAANTILFRSLQRRGRRVRVPRANRFTQRRRVGDTSGDIFYSACSW
tara:strand:+ start:354 stop:596 length:243 start_codon:yes stop_codon:yes gene_type:complete